MSSGLSYVTYCNMALSHLGISNQIQSLTPPDQSNQASVCNLWYPICRDELLQTAPWNFAYQYVNLVQEPMPSVTGPQQGLAAPGWQYSYQYPSDCLQPVAVTTLAGARYGPQFWLGYWFPMAGMTLTIPKIPFKVMQSQANPGQQCILCDFLATSQSPLYLFYIQQVTSTANFDPMFGMAYSYLIGWRAGGPLRADKQRIQDCRDSYVKMRLDALAQTLNAGQQDIERDSPSVQARW